MVIEVKAFIVKGLVVQQNNIICTSSDLAQTKNLIFAMGSRSSGLIEGKVKFVGVPCGPDGPTQVPPCSGPYPNYEILVYAADGVTLETRIRSDKVGKYKIDLIPGNYIIYLPSGPNVKKKNLVKVMSGKTTKLDLVIDVGIRTDVPPNS